MASKSTMVAGKVTYNVGKTDGKPNLRMHYSFEVPGSAIGLKAQGRKTLKVFFDMSAIES